ncbi:hypothetical protein AM1_C0360 (plasmid) [Acaryochloris marina MBIC11017]|uniref:DNA-binding protein HU n=2 Tax=Acaryochloris marina TaxID=155978 RepID=A8ZN87_ACAM1|nr:hypothetical protein AM1_C0360 [Acaryochloris marina MBIC11017]
MNKSELVDVIAGNIGVTMKQADTIITAITGTIIEIVSSGEKISLAKSLTLKFCTLFRPNRRTY